MNKRFVFLFILVFCMFQGIAQKKDKWINPGLRTLLLEKIGTRQRYSFGLGDNIKLMTKDHLVMNSYLWEINDTLISLGQDRPLLIKDIESVYPQFSFPRKFGMYMFLAGITYFTVVSLNHLINNEIVFTKDVFVIPTVLFGAGLISVSLSQKRCKIGDQWKLKVLDIRIL